MSERTVRVNGVCLTESQVREAMAELEQGDAAKITSQVCVTRWHNHLFLSVPVAVLRGAVKGAGDDRVVQVGLGPDDTEWASFSVDESECLVLTWPEIVRRLTEGVR